MLSPSEVPVKYVLGSHLRWQIRSARFPRYRCLRNNRPSQKIMVVPPLPPRSKVEQLACQPERQRLRNKRPEFKRTSANIFQLWIWGRGGGNVLKNIKYKWAIILQTPVPGKSFSSGLVLQPRAQTTNSRVLFCFRFRAVAHNESVRRTLGTKRSLAPRV